MESAEPLPGGAVKAADLADLLDRAGPFASVYLHTDPDVENARQLAEKRWKTLRGELHEVGAPEAALERRYQERVENTWERNAENVAEMLQAMARRFDPRTVVVAGDVRAVALLRESMPADLQPLVVEVAGDRPRGEKGDPIPDEVNDV